MRNSIHSLFLCFAFGFYLAPSLLLAKSNDQLLGRVSVTRQGDDTVIVQSADAEGESDPEVVQNPNPNSDSEKSWKFMIAAALWLPAIEGQQNTASGPLDFKATQGDRLRRFEPGLELNLEARKDKWILHLQPGYVSFDLSGQLNTPVGAFPVDIHAKEFIVEYWAGRRFGKESLWLDVYGGGRFINIEIDSAAGVLGDSSQVNRTSDPLVGARIGWQIYPQWLLTAHGSTAGWGVSNATSEHSRDASAGLRYKTRTGRYFVEGGYRYYDTKYNNKTLGVRQTTKYRSHGSFVQGGVQW